jgi:heme/copper-type cytochrome/quinol oxidase subunit 2
MSVLWWVSTVITIFLVLVFLFVVLMVVGLFYESRKRAKNMTDKEIKLSKYTDLLGCVDINWRLEQISKGLKRKYK